MPKNKQAAEALARAKSKWGTGWAHLSAEQRQGAVALEVLAMLVTQDEDSAPPQLRRFMELADASLRLAAPETYKD